MTDPLPAAAPEPIYLDLDIPRRVPEQPAAPTPQEVLITPQQPAIPVTIEPAAAAVPVMPPTVVKGEGTTLPPKTTEQEDIVTKGQRRINLIWESVQGFISISVTTTTIYVLASMTLKEGDVSSNQLIAVSQLVVMATLILSFYFSRTNHSAVGGEGKKPDPAKYEGR